jgi:Uma2 family endonuclease
MTEMAAGSIISTKDYLATTYRPDCEYVDGVVVDRNVGEYDHGKLQAALIIYFGSRREELGIRAVPEQRVQVSAARFRIPDVCVVLGEPDEQIFTKPPFICVEILSCDDRLSEMRERVDDCLAFGVPYAWIVDPRKRIAYRCTEAGFLETRELRTERPEIVVPLDALFD